MELRPITLLLQQVDTAVEKMRSRSSQQVAVPDPWTICRLLVKLTGKLLESHAAKSQLAEKALLAQNMKLDYLLLRVAQADSLIRRKSVVEDSDEEFKTVYASSYHPDVESSAVVKTCINDSVESIPPSAVPVPVSISASKTMALAADSVSSSQRSSEKLEKDLREQMARAEELQRVVTRAVEQIRAALDTNKESLEKLHAKLEASRGLYNELNSQNKTLKRQVKETAIKQQGVALRLACIDDDSTKSKFSAIASAVRNRGTFPGTVVYIFTEQPMSNDELTSLRESLLEHELRNVVQELSIENSYISEGSIVGGIIEDNAQTMRRVAITSSFMDVSETMKLLESVRTKKVRLDSLVLDENGLHADDMILLTKLFLATEIRRVSVKRNHISVQSIELFCRATRQHESLEEIDVGDVRISEQKELEWRTDFIALVFNRVAP